MIFGVSFDLTAFLENVFDSKITRFIFDLLMLISWGLLFFCFLLIFNNGMIRSLFFAFAGVGFLLYILTIHRILSFVGNKISAKINLLLNKLTNKLKISKKSFKKLLHSSE